MAMAYYNPGYYVAGNDYAYSGQYQYQMPPSYQNQLMQMQAQSQPQPQQRQNNFFGKVVDGEDIVKVTEVPMGGYGVFPKADLSEVYVKAWNINTGNADITTYKPVIKNQNSKTLGNDEIVNLLFQKIETLENKLDMALKPSTIAETPKQQQTSQKEVHF